MKKIIPYLKSAVAIPGYSLMLEFEDGVTGVVDLSAWKGKGVFEYWNMEDNFKTFKITKDKKIEWSEDLDMDPDAFYLKIMGKTFEEYARNKQLLWHSH
jgi:Protein of unknown function (DUF2442)